MAKSSPILRAEEMGLRIAGLQGAARRAVADHDFRARQIERQEGFDIFFRRETPGIKKNRPRQIEGSRPWPA